MPLKNIDPSLMYLCYLMRWVLIKWNYLNIINQSFPFCCILFICSTIRFFILLQLNLIYSKPVLDSRRSKTFCALTWLCVFIKTTALSIRLREKLWRKEDTIFIDFERSQSSIIVVFIIILAKSYLLALQQDFVT